MSNNDVYFAAREADEAVSVLLQKAHYWFKTLDTNGYLDKLKDMWAAYHGAYYSSVQDGHKISFSGSQGEFANLPVNHLRNICQNMLVMITATRPSMEARSVNTDYRSLVQTRLANGLLDYYMREKRLERYLKTACEYAIVLGSGYVKMEWNATGGEIHDYIDPETDPVTGEEISPGYPVYEGDVNFSNLSPFDVVVDSTKENQDHDWILCRSYKNKFDLAAKFPDQADKIVKLASKSEQDVYRFNGLGAEQTDDVPVYEFYHNKTEAMRDGRYLLFLDYDLVLMDAPMPYDYLPVYRIAPSDIIGTPYGYSPVFDLLPIQDAVNSLFSTILSNQSAFGVQNILMPRGSDIVPSSLVGGLNLIEYNAQVGKPESINFTQTPKEVFDFMQQLIKEMEIISGVNSVARGNPDPQLKSGNALALIQSMALQYMSGLQQSYVQLIEDVGTGLIKMLQRFASVPRIAMIVGKQNQTEMKEFTGDDLSSINRIIVDVGNYLARTTAGRVEMAEQMMQMKVITTPEQYLNVINTGKLETLTEDTVSELNMIRMENESLVSGEKQAVVMLTDQHSLHIKEHKAVLADPDRRLDPALVQRTIQHIQDHIDQLRNADPQLLAMMGEQALQPPPPPPGQDGGPGGPPGGPPNGPPPPPPGPHPPIQNPQGGRPPQSPPASSLPTDDGKILNSPAAGGAGIKGMKLPNPAQPPQIHAPPGMPVPQGVPKRG
jgi:hypothetical protein